MNLLLAYTMTANCTPMSAVHTCSVWRGLCLWRDFQGTAESVGFGGGNNDDQVRAVQDAVACPSLLIGCWVCIVFPPLPQLLMTMRKSTAIFIIACFVSQCLVVMDICTIEIAGVQTYYSTHTHTHTRLTALLPGLPGWAGTRKVKPIWILLKQETVSGSGISWAICKSAPCSRQITMPTPLHSVFLQAGCPSCRPNNSVKALKSYYNTV